MGIKEDWESAAPVSNSEWDNATPINAPNEGKDMSLMGRIGERYSKVARSKNLAQGALRGVGQTIGAVGDVAEAAISAAMPDSVSNAARAFFTPQGSNPYTEKVGQAIGKGVDAYGRWKAQNPELATDIESVGNIVSVLPIGKGVSLAKEGIAKGLGKAAGTEAINVAKDAAKTAWETVKTIPLKTDDPSLLKKVKSSFETAGIRPKLNKVSATQFYANSAEAVKDISRYAPEAISKSERPLEVAVAGVENAKKKLFGQADALIKEAGSEGIPMNNKKAAIEGILSPDSDFATVLDDMPDLRKELESMQKRLEVKGTATATQLQTDLTHRNSLAASREKFSKAGNQIQAILADAVRKDLDEGLSALDISGRSDFMKRYGAIKDVERQFANLAIKEYGAKPFSYLDVLSTSGGLVGLAAANPALILASMTTAGTLHALKFQVSPTRALRSMFKAVEKEQAKKAFADTLKSRYAKKHLASVDNLGMGAMDKNIPVRPVTGQRPQFTGTHQYPAYRDPALQFRGLLQ